jgi:hypothetical protein
MVDLALIAYSLIAAIGMGVAIVLVTNRATWLPMIGSAVSRVSDVWADTLERGRRQKAQRERLYGYDAMSSSELVRDAGRTSSAGGSTGSRNLVPGQQNQLEPAEPEDREPDRESFARQLAKEELIILLAVQRNEDGGYLYSANQITSFVGGAAQPIKATIANVRGKKETPPPAKALHRPLNGW